MKKIILAAIAAVMLLSNVAFASTKTTNVTNGKSYTVTSSAPITIQSQNPVGW